MTAPISKESDPPSNTAICRTAAWGLFNHKPRWGLSIRGVILLFIASLSFFVAFVFGIHPFLAVNHPIKADTLVVEGWIPDNSFPKVVAEFKQGGYKRVLTTGGPVDWSGASRFGGTYAGSSALDLQKLGLPTNAIVAVPSASADWERTYQSGLAVRNYLATNPAVGINVITVGPHARRTRLLFKRALGRDIPVGIIALHRDDYDPDHWWRTSTGVREVISEIAAYTYCRVTPFAFTDK